MENTSIEWTDHTFNPWIGCAKVSPGCAHCYAETLMDTRYGRVKWGKGQPRLRTSPDNWKKPLRWNRDYLAAVKRWEAKYAETGTSLSEAWAMHPRRPRVFCASLADWLDDEVPVEWLVDLLQLIRDTPNLDWLLLSKRPENWFTQMQRAHEVSASGELCDWIADWTEGIDIPPNIWIGTTVEDQTRATERIRWLVDIPARVRFLSCEPLLGPVDLTDVPLIEQRTPNDPRVSLNALTGHVSGPDDLIEKIHWVICGGESGPGARPMHPDWARSLRDQCLEASVPFFFKQWGEWNHTCSVDCAVEARPHRAWPNAPGLAWFPDGTVVCRDYPEQVKKAEYIVGTPRDPEGWRVFTKLNRELEDEVRAHGNGNGYFDEGTETARFKHLVEQMRTYAWQYRVGKKAAGRLLDGREWNEFPKAESEVAK